MLVVDRISEIRSVIADVKRSGHSVGFVPTMGALHAGHISLVNASRNECSYTVVSIFVNPTQFGANEDLSRYPRPREADLATCKEAGADLVFYPSTEEMYQPDAKTYVEVAGLSDLWEGAIRPGHFRGVTTVVAKLFQIVGCDRAYFGQKDFQQQLILRRMVSELNMPVEIITCPIIRDTDGLALSSRNAYLSASERESGLCLSQALRDVENAFAGGERLPDTLRSILTRRLDQQASIKIDYAVIVDPFTLTELHVPVNTMVALVAGRVGSTRLIDNALLRAER